MAMISMTMAEAEKKMEVYREIFSEVRLFRPFNAKVAFQRVFNTIKLYAKQRRLISLVTDQIYEKEKNNHMMIGIHSHIVEFRNGESGSHVLHINKLTEMLLERLMQKMDRYDICR